MTTRRVYVLLLPIMIVILTGCFRQASSPVQPVNESLSDQLTPADSQPIIQATATEADSDTAEATDTNGSSLSVSTSTPVQQVATATSPPSETPIQLATDDGGAGVTGPVQMVSPSPTFVTPVSGSQSAISTATPRATSAIEATPTDLVSEDMADACIHVVQRGETLYRISLTYGVTVADIVAVNPGINPNLILAGDEIVIPDCEPDDETATPTEDITTVGSPGEVIHVVAAGETLGRIAEQYGVTISSIVAANNLTNPDRLSIGQELIIPPPTAP